MLWQVTKSHQRLAVSLEPAVNEPIRIAFVITELDVGGAERCLVNLVTGIDRMRFEPIVYSLGPRPNEPRSTLVKQLDAAAIRTHFLNARSAWQFMRLKRRLTTLLRAHKPQIVQSFLFHANVLGTLAARSAGVPHIVTGVRVADPPRWRLSIERHLSRHADQIVCVSNSVATFLQARGKFSASKLCVIPNGIDFALFDSSEAADLTQFGIKKQHRAIVCIGRLHRQKGIDWLLTAAPELLHRLPEHELLIVGDGPERQKLTRQAKSQEAHERIHFVDWRSDIASILAASDILLLPSRWEGMPNVILEAMSSRLPVVATRAEGVVELLGPAAEEQTVEFGNTREFVETAVQIASNRECHDRLATANWARAREQFPLGRLISRYEQLYATLASR